MNALIERLLKPLPAEQSVVAQELQPLYHSRVLDNFFGGTLRISREAGAPLGGVLSWEQISYLRLNIVTKHEISPPKRIVSAIPHNDPLRQIPKNAEPESVWMLMAYLCELGPVEAPIVAVAPVMLKTGPYVAWWGRLPGVGHHLFLIRENTKNAYLRAIVNSSLMLVSQSIK